MAGALGGPASCSGCFSLSQTTSSSFSGGNQIEKRTPPGVSAAFSPVWEAPTPSLLGTLTNIRTEWAHGVWALISSFLWWARKDRPTVGLKHLPSLLRKKLSQRKGNGLPRVTQPSPKFQAQVIQEKEFNLHLHTPDMSGNLVDSVLPFHLWKTGRLGWVLLGKPVPPPLDAP